MVRTNRKYGRMSLVITIALVGLSALFVTGQNDSVSGDGSGLFESSVSLISPTSSTLIIIPPSTSATGNIIPSPLIGNNDYITSELSDFFVGMSSYFYCVSLSW